MDKGEKVKRDFTKEPLTPDEMTLGPSSLHAEGENMKEELKACRNCGRKDVLSCEDGCTCPASCLLCGAEPKYAGNESWMVSHKEGCPQKPSKGIQEISNHSSWNKWNRRTPAEISAIEALHGGGQVKPEDYIFEYFNDKYPDEMKEVLDKEHHA